MFFSTNILFYLFIFKTNILSKPDKHWCVTVIVFSPIIHCWKCKIRHKDFLSGFVIVVVSKFSYTIPFCHNQKPNIYSSSQSAHIHQPSLHSFHCHISYLLKVFSLSLSLSCFVCIAYSLLSCAACLVIEVGRKKIIGLVCYFFFSNPLDHILVFWAVFVLIFPTLV